MLDARAYGLPDDFKWRKYQVEVIETVLKAFEKGYKNVLIDAPVGFGKTLVNYCIARHFSSTIYTTPQVVLLDQIENDPLLDIAVIKGRDNYHCLIDRGKTAANGRCKRDLKFKCYEDCPYRTAKQKALYHPIAAMSFAYLIYDRFVPEEYAFGNRELIIVDEADDLEGWAEEFGSFKFKVDNQKFDSLDEIIVWAKAVLKNVNDRIWELENYVELNDNEIKELEKLRKYKIKLTVFLDKVGKNRRNWVFEKRGEYIIVKPVNVGEILNDIIWSRGEYRIASSGTIINREMFCKTTGLRLKETVIIRVPSIFQVERRPVYYYPVAKMTKELRAENYHKIAEAIARIAMKHKGEKGLIHAHSYEIAKEIYNMLDVEGIRVAMHDSSDRKKVMNRFMNDEIDVLISVGFTRGVDLKHDLCRWQVIVKVPFPDVSDIRVREIWINRKSWNWARYQAIKNIVQAYGRVVRAEDDYGVTYIIDESFGHLFRYKSQFPKYFVEAVKEIRSLEEVVPVGKAMD